MIKISEYFKDLLYHAGFKVEDFEEANFDPKEKRELITIQKLEYNLPDASFLSVTDMGKLRLRLYPHFEYNIYSKAQDRYDDMIPIFRDSKVEIDGLVELKFLGFVNHDNGWVRADFECKLTSKATKEMDKLIEAEKKEIEKDELAEKFMEPKAKKPKGKVKE